MSVAWLCVMHMIWAGRFCMTRNELQVVFKRLNIARDAAPSASEVLVQALRMCNIYETYHHTSFSLP